MEGRTEDLKQKLARLLQEAARAAVALDRANGTIRGVPHDSVIEQRAHDLGRQLSREIQRCQMGEVAAAGSVRARCPECRSAVGVDAKQRTVKSIDGPVELQDLQGYCPACRRTFFPSAGNVGV